MNNKQDADKNALGDKQSAYAGTNPNRYGQPAEENEQNNPIQDEEAQNVSGDLQKMTSEELEQARNKANEGRR